jgi:capsid protein
VEILMIANALNAPLLGAAAGGVTIKRAATPTRKGDTCVTSPGWRLSPAYDAASSTSQELSAWHPRLASADAEVLPNRDKIVARARSLYRNSGWAQGGIDKRVDAVVGPRIWFRAKPDFAAMGQSAEWASDWARKVESLFRLWGTSVRFLCDVERHDQFGGLVRLAYQHYVLDGEACAALYFKERGCPRDLHPDHRPRPAQQS